MATQPIHLYSHTRGPNPWKVSIILEELGLPYETEFVNPAELHFSSKSNLSLQELSREKVLDHLMTVALKDLMAELGLDPSKLANWADLAYSLQSSTINCEPLGMAKSIDVLCAIPLAAVAKNMEDWKTNHLGRWKDFTEDIKLDEVNGTHYITIGPTHVYSFQRG
ncbi:TdiA [Sclerotinia borealis F-4128]|uniref:TdiA n=1 Tax=Sclerotinia borealis (strain F-4128) TaxID=1432307 RepID=W9CHQ3_SCLBF|nr:TdiA [Sclerotinia borealis F-4128]